MAEYHYFSGQAEQAAKEAEAYLTSPDMGGAAVRLPDLCLLKPYPETDAAGRVCPGRAECFPCKCGESRCRSFGRLRRLSLLRERCFCHLPLPEEMPQAGSFLLLLPPGLRAFALYVQSHYLYLKQEYDHSAGIVEATLAMGRSGLSDPRHLFTSGGGDGLHEHEADRPGRSPSAHRPGRLPATDDLIEGLWGTPWAFGGHAGSGHQTGNGRKISKGSSTSPIVSLPGGVEFTTPKTGHDVVDDLTTTEFVIAMLAARDWTTQEIAEHLKISANTAKSHISEAMRKLNVQNRKDLKQYMLL